MNQLDQSPEKDHSLKDRAIIGLFGSICAFTGAAILTESAEFLPDANSVPEQALALGGVASGAVIGLFGIGLAKQAFSKD